ncbi:MAG: hypothetical protein WCV41_04000, partial [Patescibacteria group bacterium]
NYALAFCQKLINFIVNHRLAVSLSFLLTILIFAPLVALPRVLDKEYQGINIIPFGSDAHAYLSRGREVLDGNKLGSPFIREGKNEADSLVSYSEYVLLTPVKLLGLTQTTDIVTLYYIYGFAGVFFLILLIYFLVLQLSGNKLVSIAAAVFAIGGYSIVYHKALFYSDFNVYARMIYPYVSSLVLFSYFNLLVKSLKSDKLNYKIFTAVIFGLMFYVYFYTWTFTLAFNATLLLIFLVKKDLLSAKKMIFISAVGLALGSYNIARLFLRLGSEMGAQLAYYNWLSYGHGPIFSKIGFLTLIIFAVFWYRQRNDKNLPLIAAIILSGWVSLNQQIITGRMLEYGHYYFYFIVPLSIIVSFYMVWQILKNEKFKKYLFIFLIAVAFINTAGGQYRSFYSVLKAEKYQQNFRPLIDFLNRDKAPAVILSTRDISLLFTVYTPHDLFWSNTATLTNIPFQRIKDAFFVYAYLNKDSRNNFSRYIIQIMADDNNNTYFKSDYRDIEGFLSGDDYYAYIKKIATRDQILNQKRLEIVDQLNKEYSAAVLTGDGINQLLKKYGVNYLVWDKNINPEWDLSDIRGLKQLTSYNNIYLYSLNQ